MTKELVVREQRAYELTEKQVNIIANTEFVPADKRGKYDVIWASIFKGRSIGIDDFTALNEIHIVNGKPGLSAALAAGIVRKRGHVIDGELSSTEATAHGRRADNGAEMSVTFTIEDAKAAGLAGKQVWKQYTQSMLWARAVTQLCRSLFSDCFLGGVYTPEELGADYAVDADVIEHEPQAPFDSGPLPESEEAAVGIGLAEPASERAAPMGDPVVATASGSASPGELPENEDDVDALTDPGGEAGSSGANRSARAEPSGNAGSAPGSASPWAQLTALAKENGIDKQAVLEGLRERFPGRAWSDLDEDDCAVLWDHLMTRVEA